jgi:hypothetical protein
VINSVQAAIVNQSAVGSADPVIEAAVAQLVEALGPALRIAALELAEQAAAEVGAQLPEHTVDVVLSDGDPMLRIADSGTAEPRLGSEDLDARLTLRLPPSLKALIEDAAGNVGESVNGWVVDALRKRAKGKERGRGQFNQGFDL